MVFVVDPIFDLLTEVLPHQILTFTGITADISDLGYSYTQSIERYFHCLSFRRSRPSLTSIVTHADEYCTFLLFLARQLYLNGHEDLANVVYVLNRRLHAFDCFYTREIPDIFLLVHPIGTVLGQAQMSDYLVIYQGVTVGGDPKGRFPKLEENIVLFSNSALIGDTTISTGCVIGSGVRLYGTHVPSASCISSQPGSANKYSCSRWTAKDRFFI